MKRDPSIHIRLSHFTQIVKSLNISTQDMETLMDKCRQLSCDQRSITITNEKLKRDAEKTIQSSKGDTALLAEIIYSIRIRLKHRGVSKLNQADREWMQLKQLTKITNNFCNSFAIDKRKGYIEYITIAFSKISSMHSYISKFINMAETISQEYEAKLLLDEDATPDKTKAIHDDYVSLVASKTGIQEIFLNKPSKMVSFLKVKYKCEELGIEPEVWLDAQFDALEYCNGLPTPENLSSEKALERLNKYMFENNISVNKTKQENKNRNDFWDKLKNYGSEE